MAFPYIIPSTPLTYQQPDPDVPENEKIPQWWMENVRYFAQNYYNRPYSYWNQDDYIGNMSPVEKGLQYALYYLGKQRNIDYNHVTQSPGGGNLQAVWVKSKKVKNLIDRLVGQFINQLSSKEISAKSYSKRAVNQRMKLWEDVMIQFDEQSSSVLKELKDKFGILYQPPIGRKFNSQEDAEKYLYSLKDSLEQAATDLGKYVEWSNDSDTLYIEAFKQDFAPANVMAMYNYVENGRVMQKKIPFYNLIWDTRSDDPYVRDGQFCGFIERVTIPDIIRKRNSGEWIITDAEMSELKEIAKGGVFFNNVMSYYNTDSLRWWINRNTDMTVTAVTMFWIGPKDTTYLDVEDKHGNKYLVKDKKRTKGRYKVMDVHCATLLGSKYLVKHGYAENTVRSINKGFDPELPIKVLSGNTMIGDGISIIGSIAQLIDKMDYYQYKIVEITGKNAGKGYVINGSKLGDGVGSKEFISDLKTMGVHVAPGTSGEGGQTDGQPWVYPVDMTLDQSIIEYSNLYFQMERMVEDLLNLPKAVQGQQDQQIGLGVFKGMALASSVGNAALYNSLFKFNEINLQYQINLAKLVYANNEGDDVAPLIVGDRGMKVIKVTKDWLFEDLLVSVSPHDIIDDQQRQQILAIGQALAQNDRIDMLDFIDMLSSDTLTELRNQLEYGLNKRKEEAKESQMQQMQSQAMIQEQANIGMVESEKVRQEGMNERKQLETQAAILKEDLKGEKKKEIIREQNKTTTNA
jgi:hypothetical protein